MSIAFTYKTISASAEAEFKDRGSRFLAYVFPVQDLSDIKKQLHVLYELHPKAVHHCYAWRLGTDGMQYRANDDGEPSGSAGKPILGQIDSLQLTQVLIVVVRYFGGTLLGVPGLINAYKTASQWALAQTSILEKPIEKNYLLSFPYPLMNEVMRIIKQQQVNVLSQEMTLFCEMKIGIALSNLEVTLSKLQAFHELEIKEA